MAIDPAELETPLWRFSVAIYAEPGVEAACLLLQDQRRLDVPLLLACLWAGRDGALTLTGSEIGRLQQLVAPWSQDIVRPLRQARRRLKHGPFPAPSAVSAALRRQIQEAELAAEKLQLAILFNAISSLEHTPLSGCRMSAARANLTLLVSPADEAAWRCCTCLLDAALRVAPAD